MLGCVCVYVGGRACRGGVLRRGGGMLVCVWGGGGRMRVVCDKTDTICALNMTSRNMDILFPSQTSMLSLPPISQP